MKYCPNCGNQLKDNARFCGKCGNAVRELKHLETPVIEEIKRPAVKSAKKKSILPIIAASVFALIIVGISGLIFLSKKNNTGPVQNISGKLPWVTEPSDVLAASAKYDRDGILIDSKVYKYSDDGKKAECARTEKNLSQGTITRTTLNYELSKPYDISSAVNYKTYDESGNLIKEAEFEDDGKKATYYSYSNGKQSKAVYVSDTYGRDILIQQWENNTLISETKQIWNNDGTMQRRETNGEVDDYKYDKYMKYDDHGKEIASCSLSWMSAPSEPSGYIPFILTTTYTEFDSYSRKWKEDRYVNGGLNSVELFTYRPADSLGVEISIPEQRETKENMHDDLTMFKRELGDVADQFK